MNKYNPNIHHRRSIRLQGYNYAQAGLYFITLCVQDRECLFGEIVGADLRVCPNNADLRVCPENGSGEPSVLGEQSGEQSGEHTGSPLRVCPQMILNDAGQMIAKWYHELENKFPDIRCHEMVVMPNHFHCIVENVGAGLRVCPLDEHEQPESGLGGHAGPPQPVGSSQPGSPLGQVVQWFKTMTTNEYIRGVKNCGWQRFNGKLWQRNYYEHIIRNEQSYQNISNYILNNPANWNADKLNHQRANT